MHLQRELARLRHELAVDHYRCAAIIVESAAIASALVCIHIYPAGFAGGALYELQPRV